MKFTHQVIGVCEGCGKKHATQRDVAVLPDGHEASFIHTPKHWSVGLVQPGVVVATEEGAPINPFGNPVEIATRLGKPVQILLCPQCAEIHGVVTKARDAGEIIQ